MRHIDSLDGLRGLAVIMVVAVHVNFALGPLEGGVLARVLSAGWLGVDLFFVLSGFLITSILMESARRSHYYRNFYARRALRIMPLYYGYLLGLFCAAPLIARTTGEFAADLRPALPALLLYYFNFWMVTVRSHFPLVGQFWSLAVEEHFYLLWPLVVRRFVDRRLLLAGLCLGGVLATPLLRLVARAAGHSLATIHYATPFRCDGLLIGAIVAIVAAQPRASHRAAAWKILALAAGATLGLGLWQGHFYDLDLPQADLHGQATNILGGTAAAAAFGAVVYLLVTQRAPLPILGSAALRSCGKYSYGIYIFQAATIWLAVRLVPQSLSGNALWTKPAVIAVAFALAYVLAFVSYHAYEKHFLRLKARFAPSSGSASE